MKPLLDTNAFLFAIGERERLLNAAREAIEENANPSWMSAVPMRPEFSRSLGREFSMP